jgi:hypothetical protein
MVEDLNSLPVQAMRMELKKYAMRQSKDGMIISFVVHPNDINLDLIQSPIGTVYQTAMMEDPQP